MEEQIVSKDEIVEMFSLGVLEDNDSNFDNVVKLNIFLTNMNDFGIVNVIMAEVFGDHKPVRSTVEVKGLPKNAMIEMDLIATVVDYH